MTASSPIPKTFLITGTTRGIGRGLVASLLLRENSVVIAGVRDPEAKAARTLEDLPRGKESRVVVVRVDATSDTDAIDAVKTLQTAHGIENLDVVIANAGLAQSQTSVPLASLSLSETQHLFNINTLGPLRLFQAVFPLLHPGSKFVVMSSMAGSITTAVKLPFGVAAYGISKASVDYFVAKASGEYPDLVFTALHPGLVDTDMTPEEVRNLEGWELISVEESVSGMLEVLEKSKEEVGGKFLDWSGEDIPW